MAQGLQQDIFRNQFGGVRKSAWGGKSSPADQQIPSNQFSGTSQPNQNIGLPGGPPQFNVQDSPSGSAPTQQDAPSGGSQWTPPAGAVPGQAGQLPPAGFNTTSGPDGAVFYVPDAGGSQPAPAPTTAQVQQNPSAWAGTSFDPSRAISGMGSWNGGAQPQHTLEFIGNVGSNGVNSSTAPEILAARQNSGGPGYDVNQPPPGSVPIPGQPGNYMTPSGATWNTPGSTPNRSPAEYDAWLAAGQNALRAGIQNQTPEAANFLNSRLDSGGPVFSGNRNTESAYLRSFGLA
jgi:hypothetical protein